MQNIILLHGALGSRSDFDGLSDLLAKKGLIPRAFEFPGHGLAASEKEFGIGSFALALRRWIEKERLQKPLLFGYSMGGYVGLYLEALHPGTFQKITTLATKFFWNRESISRESAACNESFLLQKAPAFLKILQSKHLNCHGLLLDTAQMIRSFENKLPIGEKELLGIKAPVLICSGAEDKLVTPPESARVAGLLKCKHTIVPGVKHPLDSIAPEVLSEIIAGFAFTA